MFLKDAAILLSTLEQTHPNLFFRCSRKRYFQARTKLLKNTAQGANKSEFISAIREFLHVIHDGHTSLHATPTLNQKRLPFNTVLVEKRLFISKVLAASPGISEKAEIISVDGEPVSQYLNRMMRYMCYEVRDRALYSVALNFTYGALHANGELPVPANLRLPDGKRVSVRLLWRNMKEQPGRTPPRPVTFRYLPDLAAGYLDWKRFVDRRTYDFYCAQGVADRDDRERLALPDWEKFLRKMFAELSLKKARTLIVDLRQNAGGNTVLGDNLFEHLERVPLKRFNGYLKISPLLMQQYGDRFGKLSERFEMGSRITEEEMDSELKSDPFCELFRLKVKPEKKFSGNIVLLTGPGTYSAAETFAALVKDNGLGVLIGEPTGNGSNGPIDSLRFRLPVSGLDINVSYGFRLRPDIKKRRSRLLLPDIRAKQTIADFLRGRDSVLELAKDFISKGDFSFNV